MRLVEKALYINVAKDIVILDPLRYKPLDAFPEIKEELIRISLTGDKMSSTFKDVCLGYHYKNLPGQEKLNFQAYQVITPTKGYSSLTFLDFKVDLEKIDFTMRFDSKLLVVVDLKTLTAVCPGMAIDEQHIFRNHVGYINMGLFDGHPFLQLQVPNAVRTDTKTKVFYHPMYVAAA